MPAYFFDTSAFAKRYIKKVGSSWVTEICDKASDDPIFISELTEIEMLAAIHRRLKGRTITRDSASLALTDFDTDFADQYIPLRLTRDALDSARNVIEKYALRSYDALQLAAALECERQQAALNLSPIEFISADNELPVAASSEGLQTDNPNNHP